MLGNVLQCLEAHHQVHSLVPKWDAPAVPNTKAQVLARVLGLGMQNRFGGKVHPDYRPGARGKQGTAVTFTASDIEHVFAGSHLIGEGIAMKMLQDNVTGE